jgi:sulfur carrier protein
MILVNGEPMPWHEGMTIKDVIVARKYLFPLLVVKLNDAHVPRDRFDTALVPDLARVDVIHLMSGG